MQSSKQWSDPGHDPGEIWTIEKNIELQEKVEMEELVLTPTKLKGCTSKPLFDAVPIHHSIVPVLHLVIGIGNCLMDSMFEWIEECVEQLSPKEVTA